MANFEGLIRQALANHEATDRALRERIYASSRNALNKMLQRTGGAGSEDALARQRQLEQAIARIEAEYSSPAPSAPETARPQEPRAEPRVSPPPAAQSAARPEPRAERPFEPAPPAAEAAVPDRSPMHEARAPASPASPVDPGQQRRPRDDFEPVFDEPAEQPASYARIPSAPGPREVGAPPFRNEVRNTPDDDGVFDDDFRQEMPPRYQRKHPILRRIWPLLLAFAILLVVLWILYALFGHWQDQGNNQATQQPLPPVGEAVETQDGSILITLLEPTDLSGLITAGRGSAELINGQNRPMLRIQSLRQGGPTEANADPILLELEDGVLRQIVGKEVTVELLAKSGMSGPAQFAIQCDIGGDNICGRKRFRIGLQPERIVFSLEVAENLDRQQPAYLAINTDITNAADTTGEGDIVDIVYVRLRISEDLSN